MVDVCVSVFFNRKFRFFEPSSSCDLTNDTVFVFPTTSEILAILKQKKYHMINY